MNICFFTGNMNNGGGTEHMTQLLANELVKDKNYNIFVLSKTLKQPQPFYTLSDVIKLDALDNGSYNGVSTLLKDICLLSKYLKKNKIDVLINVDVSLGSFSLPLSVLCPKVKQIFWEHFSFHYDIGSKKNKILRKLALRLAKAYVTLTPQDADLFKAMTKKHCLVCDIPNICALEKSTLPYDINSKKMVSVGNFRVEKGFDMAIAVAKLVFEKHPDWKWELYGSGPELENLQLLVKQNEIENNFILKSRTSDMNTIYQDAALYVLPSRTEGFGLVLIEAQAYNLPLVAFDVPYGPRNVINNNVNGFLIEPFDINAMASKICEFIDNTQLRLQFCEIAGNDLNKYSVEQIVPQWKKLLGEI